MADGKTGRAAREAPIGDERAFRAETLRLEIGGRVEHFLHAGSAARPLIANDDHIAGLHPIGQDRAHRIVLALENARRASELQDAVIDARCLHHAAIKREIAVENGQPAILREGVIGFANDPAFTVEIEALPLPVLAEGRLCRHTAGRGEEESFRRIARRIALDVPFVERVAQRCRMDRRQSRMQQPAPVELAEDRHDAARAVYIFHMHVRLGGCDLAKHGHTA